MPVKKGYKTTEFWLSLAVTVISFAFASGIIPTGSAIEQGLSFISAALAALGYTVSRGIAKKGSPE